MPKARVYFAAEVAPLIGIRPFAKYPNSVTYGKWVALSISDVWCVALGDVQSYHCFLEKFLIEQYGGDKLGQALEGTIEQRGGHGTKISVRSRSGPVPVVVEQAIVESILEVQNRISKK